MTRLPAKTRGPVRREAGSSTSLASIGLRKRTDEDRSQDALNAAAPKLLRFPAVRDRTGLSRSTIWRLERQGAFPRHHRISTNAVAWVEDEIASWIRSKVSGVAV
jgi:prophage regulatory protein